MSVITKLQRILDSHYEHPKGFIGWWIGEKMIRQHKPETRWTIQNLHLEKNEEILEIGCGAGFAIQQILTMHSSLTVTGLDLSKTLLHSASIRNKRAERERRLSLVHGTVEELPFHDGQFSTVFSIHSVYFWKNRRKALEEIHRVLAPGGQVTITLCDGKDGQSWGTIEQMIETELLPLMEDLTFTQMDLLRGPVSRGYHTVAVTGKK
ncbi:class I SAM-dependent methyltransferase [Rossellomorea aquimaris]|uniref:class I SAM-dependent methyltransferase n=1 Tax=Rossellomorea aquimaris TaxID=189382 RepID=UPI001CD1E06E|nr:class I SAM-dependent methyltransferase [Rossellomorea aquimaris]MCA1054154.1 class I SAM-dependent methyltransferase [Rossellomorea aquimaris]